MAATEPQHQRVLEPSFQNGEHAIVLGAREGNIGGAIARRLCQIGYVVQEDDCYRPTAEGRIPEDMKDMIFDPDYKPPRTKFLESYDACIITLGTTHMEPFSEVSRHGFRKVMYGSLELPLECARRYVRARKKWAANVGGGPHNYPGAPGHNPDDPGDCFTSDCTYGCGCYAGPSRSGGFSEGVDPFGPCPKSPKRSGLGTLIFIGSYAHDHPFTHCTSYCTAKAGLDMAARCLAWELMPEGFRVHIVHPYHVQGTPMTEEVRGGMMKGVHHMTYDQAVEYQHKDLRMPDLLQPKDIAEMVLLLLEIPIAQWLSGTSINLYGGMR